MFVKDLHDFAVEIVRAAGEITLRYFRTSFEVEIKPDRSPVTVADRSAEEYLRGEIERRFPEDGIIGEEFGEKAGTSGRRWTIDPIDGTKSFIRGVPLYGTMIGLEDGGTCRVGAVRFPATRETLSAWSGGGCYVDGVRCRVSETGALSEALALTTDLAHFRQRRGEAALIRFIEQTRLQRTWGDCYGYLLVATGRADLMFDPILHVHDFMPLIPIIQEAGGRISNTEGEPPRNLDGVVASNGRLHEAALAMLAG